MSTAELTSRGCGKCFHVAPTSNVGASKTMAKFLIVDDSQDTVEVTTEFLESAGHRVQKG
jgi:PleD family two-component response regulator